MTKKTRYTFSIIASVAITGLVGCGDSDSPVITEAGDDRLKLLLKEPVIEKKDTSKSPSADDQAKVVPVADKDVVIKCITGLKFDVTEIEAVVGQKLNVTFQNPDVMPHNIVFVKPGAGDKVGKDGMSAGPAKHYVPDSDDVLAHSKLLNKDEEEMFSVVFDQVGEYPYICSFPGHYLLMKGVVKVGESTGGGEASAEEAKSAMPPKEQTVTCVTGLKFDVVKIELGVGQPLKLTVDNPDVMPHNLVIVNDGAADQVGKDGMTAGPAKNYVPDSDDVIVSTKLLNKDESETIEVTFDKAGTYPYICSFPGHYILMKGEIVVK